MGSHELIGQIYQCREDLAWAVSRNNVEKIGEIRTKINGLEAELSLIAARKFMSRRPPFRNAFQ